VSCLFLMFSVLSADILQFSQRQRLISLLRELVIVFATNVYIVFMYS
jgi:hypothetical protein